MRNVILTAALLAAFAQTSAAQVVVEKPWVRSTVTAQKATGAFMTLKSDKPTRLVSAESPAAKIVELHEMKMDNNVMRMQAVSGLDIVPGKPTELKPGSYHVMLIDLVKPLAPGDKVPLTLLFKGADGKDVRQQVQAEVRDMTGGSMAK